MSASTLQQLCNDAIDTVLITACKQSWGQGNVFTHVFHSVQRGGGVGFPACITGNMTSIRGAEGFGFPACITGYMIGGGLHPGGGVSASRGRGSASRSASWGREVTIHWGGGSASRVAVLTLTLGCKRALTARGFSSAVTPATPKF